MKPTFDESHGSSSSNPLPLSMRYARFMEVPEPSPIPYDPKTQMSIYGGDTLKMMGKKDKSTCTVSSSTKESILYGGNADSDRKADD